MASSRGTLRRGGGRPKGAANKLPLQLKEMIEGALDDAGGRAYLCQQARKHPRAFLALLGKLIPRDLNVSGEIRHKLESLILAGLQDKPVLPEPPSVQ